MGVFAELPPPGTDGRDGHARAGHRGACRARDHAARRGGRDGPGPGGLNVRFFEAFRLAIQTIRAQKLKSSFSLLGVFVGRVVADRFVLDRATA